MPSVVKIICAILLIIIACNSVEHHAVLAEYELPQSNAALLSGSQLNITCRAGKSGETVNLKRGRISGELIPLLATNGSNENKSTTSAIPGYTDRYSIVSVGQNDSGYYQCDYSKTANSSIGQLVVLDSKITCEKQRKPNHTIKIFTCEATYYSVTLHPTLEWITSIPSENSRMNATAVIETDAPGNVTHKIRSTVNVSYPEMAGISLTCRLYFEPTNESLSGNHVVSGNAPEYTDNCTTESIEWEGFTRSVETPTKSTLVSSHTATTASSAVVNPKKTGGTSHSSTHPASPVPQDSTRISSPLSTIGSSLSVQGSQEAKDSGSTGNTPSIPPAVFIGILAAAAAIIVTLIVAIVYVCGRSRNAGAGCFKKRITAHDDSHMIYPPSYQPLVTGAAYQGLNAGGEYGQSAYSYIDPDKIKSIGANTSSSLQHPKKPKSNDGLSLSHSPRFLHIAGQNELSTSCGKLSNGRALPNPPLEDGHTYSTPTNPYEVYDIIEDPTYQQIRNSQLGTTKPLNDDGYLITDLKPPPCSTNN